jgi:hypothetical protein
MELQVSYEESVNLIKSIPHQTCVDALPAHWVKVNSKHVKAQSICWLFCWGKTGMGSKESEDRAITVFDAIFGNKAFKQFDSKVEHEWARYARYSKVASIEAELKSRLK